MQAAIDLVLRTFHFKPLPAKPSVADDRCARDQANELAAQLLDNYRNRLARGQLRLD